MHTFFCCENRPYEKLSWVGALFPRTALDGNRIWRQLPLCTRAPVCPTCICMCVLDLSTFFCAFFMLPPRCKWYLSSLFWNFAQPRLVVWYRTFGTTCRFRLQESRECLTLGWPLKFGSIGYPETSVTNYQYVA
jgi:hypothetical protein